MIIEYNSYYGWMDGRTLFVWDRMLLFVVVFYSTTSTAITTIILYTLLIL